MNNTIKHLELIQGVINRLATDSFRMKGWAVILVSALLVLLAGEGRSDFTWIGLVPVLVFWGLDGYFLWQERLFRDLYDHVRQLDESEINFSMHANQCEQTWYKAMFSWCKAMFSMTLVSFYAALTLPTVVAIII